MKSVKIEDAIFQMVEQGTGVFTFTAPVTRMPRQTFLTEHSLNTVDLIENLGYWWQLWRWYTHSDGHKTKSSVTCVTCPYVAYGEDQITYVNKKSKKEIVVSINEIKVEKIDGKWMWLVTAEKQPRKKHTYAHALLTYDQIDGVIDFVEALNYKSVDEVIPTLYNWVKRNKINVEQFNILCTWFFK